MTNQEDRSKRVTEMNAEELAAATSEFDEEFVEDSFGDPSPEAAERLERAKQKPDSREAAPPTDVPSKGA